MHIICNFFHYPLSLLNTCSKINHVNKIHSWSYVGLIMFYIRSVIYIIRILYIRTARITLTLIKIVYNNFFLIKMIVKYIFIIILETVLWHIFEPISFYVKNIKTIIKLFEFLVLNNEKLLEWQNVVTLLFIEYIPIIQIKQIIKEERDKERKKEERERETIFRIHIKYVQMNISHTRCTKPSCLQEIIIAIKFVNQSKGCASFNIYVITRVCNLSYILISRSLFLILYRSSQLILKIFKINERRFQQNRFVYRKDLYWVHMYENFTERCNRCW